MTKLKLIKSKTRKKPFQTAPTSIGLNSRTLMRKKRQPSSVLTNNEDAYLVQWILNSCRSGFSITKGHLYDSVLFLLYEAERENPFSFDRPGRHWYEGFLETHPKLLQDLSEFKFNVDVSNNEYFIKTNLVQWLNTTTNYLKEKNCDDIRDPQRYFCCSNTKLPLSSKNDKKESVETLFTCNAAGKMLLPLIVYPYKRLIPMSIAEKTPSGDWPLGRSDKGQVVPEVAFEYMANIFLPAVKKMGIKLPVIFFVDGSNKAFLSMPLSQFCAQNQIILIGYSEYSTQDPLACKVFPPLKEKWDTLRQEWMENNRASRVSKEMIAPILNSVLDKLDKSMPLLIMKGFSDSGLFKLIKEVKNTNIGNLNIKETAWENEVADPDGEKHTVLDEKSKSLGDQNDIFSNQERDTSLLSFIEKYVAKEKIQLFRSSGPVWVGDVQDTSLFYVWRTIKIKSEV